MSHELNAPPPGAWPAGTRVLFVAPIPKEDGGTFMGHTATVTGALAPGDTAKLCGRTVRAHAELNTIELDIEPGNETVALPSWLRPIEDPDTELHRETKKRAKRHADKEATT
jgi:hypothetical protein